MLKSLICAATLSAAAPALALASGGNALPNPYYSNGFDTSTFTIVSGVKKTANPVVQHYSGPVTASDRYFSLSVGASPTPFVSAKAHGANGVFAEGGGTIVYFFAVNGPNRIVVPLTAHIVIDAVVGGSAGSSESDGGNVNVATDLMGVSRAATANSDGTKHSVVDEVVSFTATANNRQYNEIEVIGQAQVNEAPGEYGYAHLFADPFLAIDPVWAGAHPGYSLAFSPGIGNRPGPALVPEPAAWAMMATGLGFVGAVVRRRRRSVAA